VAHRLRFRDDGTFTIVQFTDVHWTQGGEEDQRSAVLMGAVLDAEQPDLVVLTGDQIFGRDCSAPTSAFRDSVAPLEERGITWASTFGNHDPEGTATREELTAVQQALPHCLSQVGPPDTTGVSNYVLRIAGSHGDDMAAALYLIDSNGAGEPRIPGLGGWAWIERDQIAWYLAQAYALAAEYPGPGKLPALAFFHIPIMEFDEMWDHHPCYGVKYEPVGGPVINTGLFAAMIDAGDVMGVFVGHEHVNDFHGELLGIRMGYGRGTGYGTYGREGFARGARIFRLHEGTRCFDTWLRLDDGSTVVEQPLHEPRGHRVMTGE
jgi:hypothetical protein